MIITIPINDFDDKALFFSDIIKNIVINDSVFIRLYYSTPLFTMNGLYISMPLKINSVEKIYNKTKCFFKVSENEALINSFNTIEKIIIKKLNLENRRPEFLIEKQLREQNIKLYNFSNDIKNQPINIICKISGIWDNGQAYGLTYKFIS